MKLAILLTATVKPTVIGGCFSIEERMKMYEGTLDYYVRAIGRKYPIVFVENSDVSIRHWKKKYQDALDLEILQFDPENEGFDNSKGKGYNEYLMIKKGLTLSSKLKACTHFLKITGRYAMENICRVIGEVEKRANDKVLFLDVKDTKIYDIIGRKNTDSGHWADSRFFVAEIAYYKENLENIYKDMNDYNGMIAEFCLFNLYKRHKENKKMLFRFRTQVQFKGQLGVADFTVNYASKLSRCKNILRQFLRYCFPNTYL